MSLIITKSFRKKGKKLSLAFSSKSRVYARDFAVHIVVVIVAGDWKTLLLNLLLLLI